MRTFALFLLFILPFAAYSQEEKPTGLAKVCEDIEKLAAFAAPLMTSNWSSIQFLPTGPVYGITSGLIQNDSPLLEFCSVYSQLKHLEKAEQIFRVLEFGNKLTNEKWGHHLTQMRDTYDIYNDTNDLAKGRNKSSYKAQAYARNLNRYLKDSQGWYNKTTDSEVGIFATRHERESKMRTIVRGAEKIGRYNEILHCPKERPLDPKVQEFYENDVGPKSELEDEMQAEVNYLVGQLKLMGIKFANSEDDFNSYHKDVFLIFNKGAQYGSKIRFHTDETHKFDKLSKKSKSKKIQTPYQQVFVKQDPKLFTNFITKYQTKWKTYTMGQAVQETKGFFDRPTNRIENEFRDKKYECRRIKFERELRASQKYQNEEKDSAEFIREIDLKVSQCLDGAKVTQEEANNLLVFYVNELKKSLLLLKRTRAEIWTMDSYYYGTTRNFSGSGESADLDVSTRENVKCSETLSPGKIAQLQVELASVNAEMREALVNEHLEKSAALKRKEERIRVAEKEEARRREIEKERKRRANTDYSKYVTFPEINGGKF